MRSPALLLTGLVFASFLAAPAPASAAAPQYVTVNLCNEYPYVKVGTVNLNAIVRPLCKPGQVVPFTLDLCQQNPLSPRLCGFGDHDKNAFAQATGQCS